jgi:polysaccharide biosynthesis transport protein
VRRQATSPWEFISLTTRVSRAAEPRKRYGFGVALPDDADQPLRRWPRILWRRRWVVIIAPVIAMGVAAGLSSRQEPLYQSSGSMIVQVNQTDTVFGSNSQAFTPPDRKLQTEILLLQGNAVYQRVRTNLGIDGYPPGVVAVASDTADLVQVAVSSGDPQTAAVLVDAYMTAYAEVKLESSVARFDAKTRELQFQIDEVQRQIDAIDDEIGESPALTDLPAADERRSLADRQASFQETLGQLQVDAALQTGGAEIVQAGFVPSEPIKPTPIRTMLLALITGLGLGVGAAFALDALDGSIRRPEDFAKLSRAPVLLASSRAVAPPDQRPIALSQPDNAAVEAYRSLRTNVQFMGIDRKLQVIQFTSAVAGEGKTTTAANLAVVLAQTGADVVIVDADLRRPRMDKVFAVVGTGGLTSSLLSEDNPVKEQELAEHLWVLPAGPLPPNPSEILSSRRMADVIQQLRQQFDFIIIDSPPVLLVSDPLAVSRQVDGVIMVIEAGKTSATQVNKAIADLEQVGAPILGVVLNRVKPRDLADGDGYGYGYGYGPVPAGG